MESRQPIDFLLYNAVVYTVDDQFSSAEAIAVTHGKIVEVGDSANLLGKYDPVQKLDAKQRFVYPGFIDAHAHFLGYGLGLRHVNLGGTKSWEEVLEKVRTSVAENDHGWITGRGWNQTDWVTPEFPDNRLLDEFFPDRPVSLIRVDGHALIANTTALKIAGVDVNRHTEGGEVQVKHGKVTGILVDNAMDLVLGKIPVPSELELKSALQAAEANCFAAGLTTIVDCGLDYELAVLVEDMHRKNELKMRLYIMMSDREKNYRFLFDNGRIKTDRLHVTSFKFFSDGALGSRGAYLLAPYSDQPESRGLLLKPEAYFDEKAALLKEHGFQMCTHAIGDAANRMMLKIYGKHLKGKNDCRWRIEHAQVLDRSDIGYFRDYGIVPSVQPTHATSDMSWAADRLGSERLSTSYAYKELLQANGWIPLGTDFPVEDISAIKTFYAAVFRKDLNGAPANGFQMENALNRQEAIKGMTIWAAKANFEEDEKGSIEKGKFADFTLLDKDLMQADEKDILLTKIVMTFVNGEKVYENSQAE